MKEEMNLGWGGSLGSCTPGSRTSSWMRSPLLLLSLCLLEWIRFGFGLGFSIEFEFLLIGSCKIVFFWVRLCVVIMQKVVKNDFYFIFLCGGLSF